MLRRPLRDDLKGSGALATNRLKHGKIIAHPQPKIIRDALTLAVLWKTTGKERTQLTFALRIGSKRQRMGYRRGVRRLQILQIIGKQF